jgi:hypothetical protein
LSMDITSVRHREGGSTRDTILPSDISLRRLVSASVTPVAGHFGEKRSGHGF